MRHTWWGRMHQDRGGVHHCVSYQSGAGQDDPYSVMAATLAPLPHPGFGIACTSTVTVKLPAGMGVYRMGALLREDQTLPCTLMTCRTRSPPCR